jgi:hypothetical protein
LGNTGASDKKIKKTLTDYYETERTRIHLEIEETFETSELSNFRRNAKKKESDKDKNSGNNQPSTKTNTPNFII